MMRRRTAGVMIGLVLAACSPEPMIDFADGTSTRASHWDDRWLVINYWAEWCAPCREEIPELNDLHAQRGANRVVVLGVNYDGLRQPELGEVATRMDIKFPILRDDPRFQYGYEQPAQLPVTVLISPEREVSEILVGPQSADSILAAIR